MSRSRPRVPYLFLDRDGTLIVEQHYMNDPKKISIETGVVLGLKRFVAAGYRLSVVSNQSGIARGLVTVEDVEAVNAGIAEELRAFGIGIASWHYCPHLPSEGCECRKPGTALFKAADERWPVDWGQSIMVGDKKTDVEAGRALGMKSVLVLTGYGNVNADWARGEGFLIATSISDLADRLEFP